MHTSNYTACNAGYDWTVAVVEKVLGVCSASGNSRGMTGSTGEEVSGWGNNLYKAATACSADGRALSWSWFGDAACSSKLATASFFADSVTSGGVTTMTIYSVSCINPDNSMACSDRNAYQKAICGSGQGAEGFVLEGMSLEWVGKPAGTVVSIAPDSCIYVFGATNATCRLSSDVSIPPHSLVTGRLLGATKTSKHQSKESHFCKIHNIKEGRETADSSFPVAHVDERGEAGDTRVRNSSFDRTV